MIFDIGQKNVKKSKKKKKLVNVISFSPLVPIIVICEETKIIVSLNTNLYMPMPIGEKIVEENILL